MHSIIAQRDGLEIEEIELHLFGGVSKIKSEPKTPSSEMKISAVGPLTSLLLGGVLLGLFFIPITMPTLLSTMIFYLGITNVILGLFNLIPAFPMDGGRILRAFLWKRKQNLLSATQSASKIGEFIGYGIMGFGVVEFILGSAIGGFWLFIIGWFLIQTTKQAYLQTLQQVKISRLKVSEIQSLPKITINVTASVEQAVEDYFYRYEKMYFPIVERETIIGIISINDVLNVPFDKRPEITVGERMKPIELYPSLKSNETGEEIFQKLREQDNSPQILVVREALEDKIVGFIGEEELRLAMRLSQLGTQTAKF